VAVSYSKYNKIQNSTIINYYDYGIHLWKATYNRILNNMIENTLKLNNKIMYIGYSSNNTIYKNSFFDYGNELYFYNSSDNWLFLNNFINATIYQYSSNSKLNTTKVTYIYHGKNYTNYLGNYYNNYKGKDSNNDGIGDTAYKLDSTIDKYPLMEPCRSYHIVT